MEQTQRTDLSTPEVREDAKAAALARKELGPDSSDYVLDAFIASIEDRIDARVDARVRERMAGVEGKMERASSAHPVANAGNPTEIVGASFGIAVPLMVIAGVFAHAGGIIAVVVGVILVNLLYVVDRWVMMNLRNQ